MKYSDLVKNSEGVRWAVGKDIVHGTRPYQARTRNGTFDDAVIAWVNIEQVFAKADKGFTLDVNHPTGGENGIGDRVAKAKAHFASGVMDPSEIGWNSWYNTIDFSDGRHRMVAAYQLGAKYAPVIVLKSDLPKIKSAVEVIEVEEIAKQYL